MAQKQIMPKGMKLNTPEHLWENLELMIDSILQKIIKTSTESMVFIATGQFHKLYVVLNLFCWLVVFFSFNLALVCLYQSFNCILVFCASVPLFSIIIPLLFHSL